MNFDQFLAPVDATRVRRVLEKFALRGLDKLALTGGLALQANWIARGLDTNVRPLSDLDIVVESFSSIPDALATEFLVRHIHPHAPAGKLLMQVVDPSEAVRVDVFRPCGATMARSQSVRFGTAPIQVVSLEDLAARAASLLMGIEQSATVARKHAQAFDSMLPFIDPDRAEIAWQDQRKPRDPSAFKEASARIRSLLESRSNLLIEVEYSRDVDAVCPWCEEIGLLRLSSAAKIMSILGYC